MRRSDPFIGILNVFRALYPQSGGPLTFLRDVYRICGEHGLDCQYLSLAPGPIIEGLSTPCWTSNAKGGRRLLAFTMHCWRLVPRVELVHLHGVVDWHFLILATICVLRGHPFVVSPHGSLSQAWLANQGARKRIYVRWVARWLLRHSRAVIAFSELERESISSLDARIPVEVVRPAVWPNEPLQTPATGALNILFLGRLVEVKRLTDLLQAVALLKQENRRPHLHILGEGDEVYVRQIRQLAETLHVTDELSFYGFVPKAQQRSVMEKCQVMALPSVSENFSYATAECLALGLPVVLTDTVGLAGEVERYRAGKVVVVGDVRRLADALGEFADARSRNEFVQGAIRLAQDRLSPVAMAGALMRIYCSRKGALS